MSRLQKDVNKAAGRNEPPSSDGVKAGAGVQFRFQKENVGNRTGESSGVPSSCFRKVKLSIQFTAQTQHNQLPV